jgi:6-phosphofructokinase 2
MSSSASILTLTVNPAIDLSSKVERVVAEKKLRCSPPRYDAGGGGLNVCRVIRRLGGEARAIFPAGGPLGELLRELLRDEEVPCQVATIQDQTRLSVTISEKETSQQFRFVLPGPALEEREWRELMAMLSDLDPFPAYLVASGSLSPGIPDSFFAELAGLVGARRGKLVVDTSGEPLRAALDAGVFLVKPNLNELQQLAGKEISHEQEIWELASGVVESGGAEVAVVSLGRGGALLVSRETQCWVRSPTVPIRSKVGAGDSMTAGLTLALARGSSEVEALMLGVAAGAAAVMTPGTELCRREDVERLYADMQRAGAGEYSKPGKGSD